MAAVGLRPMPATTCPSSSRKLGPGWLGRCDWPRLHKRISKWGERTEGKCIVPIRRLDADGDPIGPKRFRFGDVLDLLMSEGATRLDDEFTRQAS